MTDLLDLVPKNNTIEIILKNPIPGDNYDDILFNEDGTEMSVTVYAPHSREYKAAVHNQTQKRLKVAQDKKQREFTFDDFEDISLELFADTTVDWNITWDKKTPKFDKKLAKEVYGKAFWIKEQIDRGVQEASVFI